MTASRPAKSHGFDPAELHEHWRGEARAAGFNPDRLTAAARPGQKRRAHDSVDEDLIDEALHRASQEASSWLRADIARHLATILEPHTAAAATDLVCEIDRLAALADDRCTPLGPEHPAGRTRADGRPVTEHVTDRKLTTVAVLHEELDLQAWATRSTQAVSSTGDPQGDAARAVAGTDDLVVVVGPAGTGKTRTTAAAVTALRAQGRPVVGLAPSGKAADVLGREAGCATNTVAGFLVTHQHRHWPSEWPTGTTVILDEAGMISTTDLARLVQLVRENRWRLVTVGDPEQLPAVERGGV